MPTNANSVRPPREKVWEYPRPPRLEVCDLPLKIIFNGETVAQTETSYRVLETSHPPVYYLPPNAADQDFLQPVSGTTFCEWKGTARYFDLVVGERCAPRVVWCYPDPVPAFAPIKDYLAFYAEPLDACYVDGERVQPQPGNFYGGWITSWIEGPFKGVPAPWGGDRMKKQDLPTKTCPVCGRPFTWRKKWARCWDDVKYCSERCRRTRTATPKH